MAHHYDKKTLKMRLKTDFSKLHQTSQENVSKMTSETKSNRIEKSSTTQQDLFQQLHAKQKRGNQVSNFKKVATENKTSLYYCFLIKEQLIDKSPKKIKMS